MSPEQLQVLAAGPTYVIPLGTPTLGRRFAGLVVVEVSARELRECGEAIAKYVEESVLTRRTHGQPFEVVVWPSH